MIWGSIFNEKPMLFAVKHILSYQCVGKGKVLTVKTIVFSMKIGPKITCEICRKFLFFYFMLEMYLLTLVSVENSWERFRGPTNSKKMSEIARYFAKFITIGFPIQMDICYRPSFRLQFGSLLKSAGEMTSRENY